MKIYPKFKKVLSFILTFSILLSIIPSFSLTASATTVTVLDGKISISDTANSNTVSNGVVTITAKGSLFSKKTNTITITNSSGKTSTISFDYSATSANNFTIDGEDPGTRSSNYSKKLDNGGAIKIVLTSNSGLSNTTATLTLKNISCVEVRESSTITFQHDSDLGSITVGGQNVTDDNNKFTITSAGATIVATPKSGNVFVGWFDASDNSIISQNKSYDIVPSKSEQTIKAVFKSASADAMFLVDGILYNNLNVAVTKGNKVILIADGTLPAGDYNIPSGVTLLIPFDDSHTSYGSDPETIETPSNPTSPVVYRTLTLSDGATITVNGNIEVAAKHYASHGGSAIGGRPAKEYGYIVMEGNSKIILNSGANLYAWGYISGSDQAEVVAESGATIYEKMQVADYRGGKATVLLADNGFFPFSQYYVQNVEVHETIKHGANLICHAGIYASSIQKMPLNFMGTNAMFTLEEGASATKFYDVNTDRLIIDVNGNFSFNPIKISFKYIFTQEYDTKDFVLPLNQNITINIKSGTSTINQDIMLQPGANVNIEDGAKLNLLSGKKVYLMDSDDWDKYCFGKKLVAVTYVPTLKAAPNIRTENNIQDAKVNINGTLIVDGAIFATSNHASIVSAGKTGVIQFNSAVIEKDSIIQNTANDDSGKVTISMTPVLLTNGNTAYPTTDTSGTAANTTYYYNTDCDMWVTHGSTGHNGGNNAGEVTKEPTCTEKGEKQLTCICGHSYTEEVDPLGHSYNGVITTDPTCTEKGVKTFTCSACGHSYTEEVDPLGHSYSAVVTAPTCTEQGYTTYTCSQCGDSYVVDYVDATGHDYEAVVTPPTCNDRGYTTYTCHCGDSYVVDYVDATGHSYNAVVTAPTCTEQGYTTYTCSQCGDSYVVDYVDATGHDYEAVVTPPTCNDEGYTTYTCHCGDTYTGDKTSALGHKDDDHNHVCDNGCDVYQGTHADSPNDNDHVCDYGCGAVLEECVDTNKDHKCDYGCDKVYGVCEDKDRDHKCDYGCDKVHGTCEDKDFDHKCDYGCDKVHGTCEDKDHDHKCDYGCDKVYGVCEDKDRDHKCDYGCDKTYGEHSDSDDDKDHLCDYCKEKVEECHGGKATCTEDAVCVECGEVYEKALGHSFDNELDVSCNRDGCDFTREAYIGDVSYATFEDALAAAKEGDTIVVLSKIVIEGERTLDLTGITIDSKYVDFDNYAMVVKGNLTINGGSFKFDNYYGIGVTGKLTVNGGKFTTTKDYYLIGNFGETVINGGEFEALYCNVNSFAGTVNITGGKFTVPNDPYAEYPPCDVFAEDGGEAIITGGDFSTDVTNYCPDGHTVENNDGRFIYGEHVYTTVVTKPTCTEKGHTTYTCSQCGDSYTDNETAATGHSFDDDFDADCNNGCGYVRDAKTLVAMIGEIKFDSLTEAVLTAKDGETIVLCKDVALTEKLVVATTQKWDFGSYTVTLANGDENYSLVVKGDLTIESGTFVVSGWYGIGVTGKLTVNGGTIEYSEYNDYLIGNWGETVINGGTFNGQYCCVNNFAGNTVINGGDFTTELKDATGEYDSCDLMADSGLIVNGGTFSKDVTIYCDNDYHTCDVDGDGRFVYEEHSYDSVVTEPTCTEKGYTTYTCHCGDSYVGDNVDATGHDYAETVTDPTCTKKGYTTHTCTICGDSYTDNETDATGHDYAETVTDPTCTEDGYTTHTCTVCGDSYTDNETDATGHSYDDDFDATCNNGCGHVREAKILVAMIGNTKFDSLSEAVNTAKDGETIVLFKDVVLTEKLNVESTQKWDFGNYTVTLADVNDNYGLVVTGDLTIESGNFVAPGLYGIGVTGKLTVNGGMFKTTKDYYLIGNFGETVINGGEFEALYCNVNSFAGTVNITGGKFTVTDYSYPDYPPSDVFAEDGGEAIITGGDFSTDVTNYCPGGHTVKNDGNRYIYGEHVYTTVVTKPTCTEKGHTTYTCECGDTYVDSYVDANGHEYDAVVTDPTCTEGGYTTHTCTVCDDSYVDSYVDASGHDYDDVITEPTCTEGGYTTHTCTVCGDTYVDSYVDENGHTHGGYEYDLCKHWSICSVDGCGVRFCEEDHVFIDDACKCGAKRVSVDKVGNTEINYTVIGQTVTVTHEDACTVVYISDGEYVKLDAVVNGDGSYSFTAPENVTEVQLFVIGDYDGNGALTEEDATSLRNALLGKETLNDTPEFIYDVSGDGKVTALDLALISAAAQRSIKLG